MSLNIQFIIKNALISPILPLAIAVALSDSVRAASAQQGFSAQETKSLNDYSAQIGSFEFAASAFIVIVALTELYILNQLLKCIGFRGLSHCLSDMFCPRQSED